MATTQKFLKKGVDIVVLKKGAKPAQCKTGEELVLTNVNTDSMNPVSQQPCYSSDIKGDVTIFFAGVKLRSRIVLEEGDITTPVLNEQLCQIDYDVPSKGRSAGFTPVALLHTVAVPMTESVWLVRAGHVPHNLIAHMEDLGCKVDVTLLDLSETRKKVCRSIQFLQDKITSTIESANECMANAQEALEAVANDKNNPNLKEACEKYIKRSKEVDGRLRKLFKNMKEGTYKFGIGDGAFGPQQLANHAALIRQTALERAQAYAKGTQALENLQTPDAKAVVTQAQNNELPIFVMSDMLQESDNQENQEIAQNLNETFGLTESVDSENESEVEA